MRLYTTAEENQNSEIEDLQRDNDSLNYTIKELNAYILSLEAKISHV